MGGNHGHAEQEQEHEVPVVPDHDPFVAQFTPKDHNHIRAQPRVRPQWDPAELAKKYLDEMETKGRLHNLNQRPR